MALAEEEQRRQEESSAREKKRKSTEEAMKKRQEQEEQRKVQAEKERKMEEDAREKKQKHRARKRRQEEEEAEKKKKERKSEEGMQRAKKILKSNGTRNKNEKLCTPPSNDHQLKKIGTPSSVRSNASVPSPVRPFCLSQNILDMEFEESTQKDKARRILPTKNSQHKQRQRSVGSRKLKKDVEKAVVKKKPGKNLDIFASNSPLFSPSISSKYVKPKKASVAKPLGKVKSTSRSTTQLPKKAKSRVVQSQASSMGGSKLPRARRKKKKSTGESRTVENDLDFSFG